MISSVGNLPSNVWIDDSSERQDALSVKPIPAKESMQLRDPCNSNIAFTKLFDDIDNEMYKHDSEEDSSY